MLIHLIRFLEDESGNNLIEYALVAALLSITIFGSLETMGGTVSDWFFAISGELDAAAGTGSAPTPPPTP